MPVHPQSCSSRATRGFSLVELTATVVLVAVLAGGALWYYRAVAADSRSGVAQEELSRIAGEIARWTLTPGRKMPRSTAELPRMGGQEVMDPWGTPYVIQQEGGRVASAGPNRVLETAELAPLTGDDLVVKFSGPRPLPPAAPAPPDPPCH